MVICSTKFLLSLHWIDLLLSSSCSDRIEEVISKLVELFPKSSLQSEGIGD